MAILFVGSSPSDLGGITSPYTGTLGRDANFTPVASLVSGDFDDIGGGFVINPLPAVTDTMWLHFLMNTQNAVGYSSFPDGYFMRIFNGSTEIARIDVQDSLYTLQGGGQTSPNFSPWIQNQNTTYDIKCVCDGTNVTVEVYIGGALQASITYASAIGVPTSYTFDHFDTNWNTSAIDWRYSEFIVTDNESTIGWRLATLEPNAAGTYTAWEGVPTNLAVLGDGLSISSDTAGEKESWTLSAYGGPATASGVRAVVNKFFAQAGGTPPTQIRPFIRHAATDVAGTTFTPSGAFHLEVLDNNPQTTLTWDTADLATLEVGVESIT